MIIFWKSWIIRPMLAILSVMSGITKAFTSTREPGSSWEDRVFLSTFPLAVARSMGGPPVVQAARSALDRLAPPT
eukprot:5811395-Heterocapsa_arctica.AAC.1